MSESVKKIILENKELTSTELSKLTGAPKSTIRSFLQRNGIDKSIDIFNKSVDEVSELYTETKSSRAVAKHYNISHKTILKFLNDNGVSTQKQEFLKESGKSFIVENYNRMTSTMLAKKFNVSTSYVSALWSKHGLQGKNKKLYIFENEDYFSTINTHQKAYFLGLIASDGCLYKSKDINKQGIVKISLHKQDKDILEYFRVELGLEKPLNYYKNTVILEIVSEKMFCDLFKYGLTPKKTWSINVTNLPCDFIVGFLLGYFDGDGSISWSECNIGKNRVSGCGISFCGTETAKNTLCNFLSMSKLDYIVVKDNRESYYNGNFYNIVFANTVQKYCFLKTIYSKDIYCLSRKKERANKLIFAIENNLSNRKENINAVLKYKEKCHPM